MSISLTAFTFVNLLLKKVGVKTYYKPLKAFYSDQLHHCFFFFPPSDEHMPKLPNARSAHGKNMLHREGCR